MTRHDEPAEGDVAGVAEVLAAHRFHPSSGTLGYGWCQGGDSWETKTIAEHEAHVADALRDLLAAAEQRGRVAALREAVEDHAQTFGPAASASRMWLRERLAATERAQ